MKKLLTTPLSLSLRLYKTSHWLFLTGVFAAVLAFLVYVCRAGVRIKRSQKSLSY